MVQLPSLVFHWHVDAAIASAAPASLLYAPEPSQSNAGGEITLTGGINSGAAVQADASTISMAA